MYLITLNYTLKDDYDEILCYVHCHNKKIEEKIKKKIHSHTNQFSHTNATLLNTVKQNSQKEKQFCLPRNSIMYSQNMLSWIQSSHVSISLRISPHSVYRLSFFQTIGALNTSILVFN